VAAGVALLPPLAGDALKKHMSLRRSTSNAESIANVAVTSPAAVTQTPQQSVPEDIVDEALQLYRINVLFRSFDIRGPADRTLVYAILFIGDCLGRIAAFTRSSNTASSNNNNNNNNNNSNSTSVEIQRNLVNHATTTFPMPGEAGFALNAMFPTPTSREEYENLRVYLSLLRNEIATRLVERVYTDPVTGELMKTPSKWWMGFARRKFMNKTL
jgi:actin related protein 2/3 complex, subunit 3